MNVKDIINKLYEVNSASKKELLYLLDNINEGEKDYLISKAHDTRMKYYSNKVYLRGLIELTSFL